ncbi:hypothetical protein JTB14_036480 [Gonioctena quinquepunctata]|nr:hypothetical protein JTB14_036480 [Gonioctena quinquepunctata]
MYGQCGQEVRYRYGQCRSGSQGTGGRCKEYGTVGQVSELDRVSAGRYRVECTGNKDQGRDRVAGMRLLRSWSTGARINESRSSGRQVIRGQIGEVRADEISDQGHGTGPLAESGNRTGLQ